MPFESLSLGTQAMRAAQSALSVIGHNIANVNTEGYSRQRAELVTNIPLDKFPGQIGTGVRVDNVMRIKDDFTRIQIEKENQLLGEFEASTGFLEEVEQILDEPQETGLQNALAEFFNSWHTLANAPEDFSSRNIVFETANSLSNKLNSLSGQLNEIQNQADEYVRIKVDEINSISERIATLNSRISSVEANPDQHANDLRDQRELLVKELSKIIDVRTYEDNNKLLLVETQGLVLVSGTRSNPITTSTNAQGRLVPAERITLDPLVIRGGELKGVLDTRDVKIQGYLNQLNDLAGQLIDNVNALHTQGAVLGGYDSITSRNQVANPAAVLNTQNYDYPPQNGNFTLTVYNDSTGAVVESADIAVDVTTDTINDIIADINTNLTTVTASLDSSGRLVIQTNSSNHFQFIDETTGAGDTSGLLQALGINDFFEGTNAQNIGVRNDIAANLNLIAAGNSDSPGSNENALEIASLQVNKLLSNGTATFEEFYASITTDLGTDVLIANRNLESQESLLLLLEERQASTTGVSLDEEAANLIFYQRMFQASAKFVQVADSLLETLINRI